MCLVSSDSNLVVSFGNDGCFRFISCATKNLGICNIVVLVRTLDLFDFISRSFRPLGNLRFISSDFMRCAECYRDF
jgi:hypothetical protein